MRIKIREEENHNIRLKKEFLNLIYLGSVVHVEFEECLILMDVLLRMIEILFEFSDILNKELLEYFFSPDDIMNLQIRIIHDDILIKIESS